MSQAAEARTFDSEDSGCTRSLSVYLKEEGFFSSTETDSASSSEPAENIEEIPGRPMPPR